ncbi:hypothetical protein V496_03486, partial [Pseudogymnoascus sp. VKM F-4515 (FW-2607)]
PASKDPHAAFPLDGQDFQNVPDSTLLALFETAPVIHRFGGTQVVRLSRTLVVKGGSSVFPAEAAAMALAKRETGIPLPAVHRVVPGKPDDGFDGERCYIVMNYVEGEGLDVCWARLDAEARADVALQIANMIEELSTVTLTIPGPIGGARRCHGPWFSDYGAENFDTLAQMEGWFNHKLDICQGFSEASRTTPRFAFEKLVLTHQDIAPRNIILDAGGKAWLIDWAFAGAYPEGFERVALFIQNRFHSPEFNDEVCKLIAPYPELEDQRVMIAYGLTTAALA